MDDHRDGFKNWLEHKDLDIQNKQDLIPASRLQSNEMAFLKSKRDAIAEAHSLFDEYLHGIETPII